MSTKFKLFFKILLLCINPIKFMSIGFESFLEQINIVGPNTLFITMITSFFISLVLNLQVVKEFLYLNAHDLVGSMLAIAFIRELSPVLTSIIVVGKIGSFFTSELATMVVTEQIDALLLLGINPVYYLVIPRVTAVTIVLPLLHLFSLSTSFMSSAFICFILYGLDSRFFFSSLLYSSIVSDLFKSLIKTMVFGLVISIISCVLGITSQKGSNGVGLSTTLSVVFSLISIFFLNFLLSYCMFNNFSSSFQF
uniref:ABC transporter permease n=1 Tax=Polysiphonia scopulorum TaxID=257860 RepID=A0A1Z1MIF9_9FLOR|nr:hypothetical protein [Polysiphonia scopulorum]ARW65524.1 hypothetical protein [Polysiphonia scopulorum]